MTVRILVGDALTRLRSLENGSVHCCVTSPPYWGLRDYGTGTWEGGDPSCAHRGRPKPGRDTVGKDERGNGTFGQTRGVQDQRAIHHVPVRDVCRCGARRIDHQVGLEASPDEYIAKMVAFFREVRRVLRDVPDERRAAKVARLGTAASDRDVSEGRVRVMTFSAGDYPGCVAHGAMHRLSGTTEVFRCGECGVGCEATR